MTPIRRIHLIELADLLANQTSNGVYPVRRYLVRTIIKQGREM